MKRQNGFAPILILLFVGIVSTGIIGYARFNKPVQKIVRQQVILPSILPTVIPSNTPTKAPKPTFIPTLIPTTVSSATNTINVFINNNGNAILDNSLELHVRNENTTEEIKLKNKSSNWKITNLTPGKYKITVPFSSNSYFNPERDCTGCREKEDKSNMDTCGYVVKLAAGDEITITCRLNALKALNQPVTNTNTSTNPDTTPPTTNLFYPQPNGSITYKTDGKICAYASAPSDDRSFQEVETEYKFDDQPWSGYATGRGYLCADNLPNGQHTLSYHSKDKTGNVETTKTISFSVNIPGN